MPGPGKNKGKGKPKSKAGVHQGTKTEPKATPSIQCLTLDEDEIARCGQPATEGHPRPERCKVHHGQYRIMYKKYKDASHVVDEIKKGAELPTDEQIGRYADYHAALDKARWVRKYLEAIRVERAGRNLHQRRFFLKGKCFVFHDADDGHKFRLKLLQKEMVKAVDTLDKLQARAFKLYMPDSPLHDLNNTVQSTFDPDLPKRTTEEVVEIVQSPDRLRNLVSITGKKLLAPGPTSGTGDEDLIDISLRAAPRGSRTVSNFESFWSTFSPTPGEPARVTWKTRFFIYQQFSRRIILHQPHLFMKSLEKVSFKDFILGDDFSLEDLFNFHELFRSPLKFPLLWFKDAILDALAISRHGTAANVGRLENRFSLLGGWVFNRAHTGTMSNEGWWHLVTMLEPPADIENRFVRVCNNFDDLVSFLSFGALGLVPRPSFCKSRPTDLLDPRLSRGHLSLSGVVVADMVSNARPPHMRGPIPTPRKAKKRGCVVWAEVESRAYMFGAVRNEPDAFTDAFLGELRARPDLFQVVTRSETDPGQEVEISGAGPSEALPQMRGRSFEAPPSLSPPQGVGEWQLTRSAVDVLYGTGKEIQGYLTLLSRNEKGWFFSLKKFNVKYFVILDTVPYRDHSILASNVAWAALCAGGYGKGEYDPRKHAIASDKLFQKCANERLGWLPKEVKWEATKMEDNLR
ncbi:hypothetical protein PAXINDRAFT_14806 [Paxillus involutus ATCC 200175]|uniref:Uncharacterized protein n=1 Tax=Paxillus involutus ATCC 200175 TaxID=664439 RepID=A0A0C9TP56_PAXIN|nr:hypothetical protein PAXINDRAFT_14806 [Paxillus involutus ATCC 200175]